MDIIKRSAERISRNVGRRVAPLLHRPRPIVEDPIESGRRAKSGMRIDLTGRVALVTGASGELGRAIACTLGACGADIVVHYFSGADRAEAVLREIKALGVRACAVASDVTSWDSVCAMRDTVVERLGPVDILVSNAIAWYPKKSVLDQSVEAFEGVFRTSVLQNVVLAKAFVPLMIERRWGRMIGISSEVAMQALPEYAAYTAGKRGMDGVLRTLTRELGSHQITVNQVAPGWVISDRDRASKTQRDHGYESWVPLKRRGYDQDVANAVAFLASDLAAFVSGVYLPVCGGNVMPGI